MYRFTILPNPSWYTFPTTLLGKQNFRTLGLYISTSIDAFYNSEYQSADNIRRQTFGTVENIITTLKNQFLDQSEENLHQAVEYLFQILNDDLPQILQITGKENLTVCVVPRAKAESNYSPDQLLFKQLVSVTISDFKGFNDGTNYIIRHTNTRTTHLDRTGYGGDGNLPYPGITKRTCTISDDVRGKDILLIDDLYTESVNIDEDAIQALLDNGANSVVFYSLGKTVQRT